MNLHIKHRIREIICRNSHVNIDFRDDDILLLKVLTPAEFCGVLLELQRIYCIHFNDGAILGKELETVNSIYSYIIHHIEENVSKHSNSQSTDD